MKNYNKIIKEKRIELGMTQKELAEKSGVPLSTIKKYDSGNRSPKYDNLFKLIDALKINYHDVFGPIVITDQIGFDEIQEFLECYEGVYDKDFALFNHSFLNMLKSLKKGLQISPNSYNKIIYYLSNIFSLIEMNFEIPKEYIGGPNLSSDREFTDNLKESLEYEINDIIKELNIHWKNMRKLENNPS